MSGRAPLSIGVIGFGKMGMLHAGVVSGLRSAELAAVADTSGPLLAAFRESRPGVPTYEDYEAMLARERLDAVVITSPTYLHVPMALRCVERGLAFLVEKPLSTTAAEARPLLDALARRPVVHAVGYMGRHADTFAKAKEVLASRPIGRPIHVRATMYVSQLFRKGRGWRYDAGQSGGGVLVTQNSHLLDLLAWYFGPVRRVSGQTKSFYSRRVEDFAHAWLGFDGGLTGFIDTSWSVRHHRTVDVAIDVEGENGTLAVTDDDVRVYLDAPRGGLPAGWTAWRKPDLYRPVEVDIAGPEYTRQDAEFLEAVAAGRQLECDARSAFRVQQAIDAIYASAARAGEPVPVAAEAA